jgi:hypothetical protein
MPEFDDAAGDVFRNLLQSLREGSERLPSPIAMMHSLRELDATPQQIGVFVGECLDVAAKAAMEIAQGVREAGKTLRDQEPDFDVPDDLSDLE